MPTSRFVGMVTTRCRPPNQEFKIDWGSVMAQESHDHVVAALRERIDNLIAADTSAHLEAVRQLRCAIESRDLIGQAKGS